jgi:hypothetical protein
MSRCFNLAIILLVFGESFQDGLRRCRSKLQDR